MLHFSFYAYHFQNSPDRMSVSCAQQQTMCLRIFKLGAGKTSQETCAVVTHVTQRCGRTSIPGNFQGKGTVDMFQGWQQSPFISGLDIPQQVFQNNLVSSLLPSGQLLLSHNSHRNSRPMRKQTAVLHLTLTARTSLAEKGNFYFTSGAAQVSHSRNW